MLISIDVNFLSSIACFLAMSGEKGMFSSADILQKLIKGAKKVSFTACLNGKL